MVMAKRKTFDVQEFKTSINRMLAGSVISPEGRKSMMIVLEDVLMQTGNYKGYRYLGENEVPFGHPPGINNSAYEITDKPSTEDLFFLTDDTRICYL
jgi:hypothetical protein